MANVIEHIDTETLEYYSKKLHGEILTHIKMNNPAQQYWQEQYDKLFSKEYTFGVSVSATPNKIDPQKIVGDSVNITFTATFSATLTTKTPDGTTVTHPEISDVTPITDGWTKVSASTYTKTIELKDFTKNYVESITGTINLLEPTAEGATVNNPTVKGSATVSISRPNIWFNSIDELTTEAFNELYKEAPNFELKKGQEFQSVMSKPIIFASTNSKLAFEQSGNSIIINKAAISTCLGTYNIYITGKGNGNIWNSVTISLIE